MKKPKPRNPYVAPARAKKAGVHTSKDKKRGGRRGGPRHQEEYDEDYSMRVVESDGTVLHYDNDGHMHRTKGPAYQSGTLSIYMNHGLRHREDGPAVSFHRSGEEEYWLYNKRVEPFTPEQLPLILLNLSLEETE